jgi:hypothetical protein
MMHRFGSLCHVIGDALRVERLPLTSANEINIVAKRAAPLNCLWRI